VLGSKLGNVIGLPDSMVLGCPLGKLLGSRLGNKLGNTLGLLDSTKVGLSDRKIVGSPLITSVGSVEGSFDGVAVGTPVNSSLPSNESKNPSLRVNVPSSTKNSIFNSISFVSLVLPSSLVTVITTR